jgi:hypothetical protein
LLGDKRERKERAGRAGEMQKTAPEEGYHDIVKRQD